MRNLTDIEQERLKLLTRNSINLTLLEPTATALGKYIIDATIPVRHYLLENEVHDYELQKQGKENKVIVPSKLLNVDSVTVSQASLYRPPSKDGDPRIWFKNLRAYANGSDILSIIYFRGSFYVINLTRIDIEKSIVKQIGPIWELISEIKGETSQISKELLGKISAIAKTGLVPSVMEGKASTAIGRTLETMLGIPINSSKNPDYKGIELKSHRAKKSSRVNLYAKVPNWKLSKLKSSREILDTFGYIRDGDKDKRLYCTVKTNIRNPQGLKLILHEKEDILAENSDRKELNDFAIWLMEDLRKELLKKHNETFWVTADTEIINDIEYFQFKKVLHTRKPILSQFDILINQGLITLDHLVKREDGKVKEKGPLFKIKENSIELLFPPSISYTLI